MQATLKVLTHSKSGCEICKTSHTKSKWITFSALFNPLDSYIYMYIFHTTRHCFFYVPDRDLWCELRVPAGRLSHLLRLQWLPVLQTALLHAFREDWDEADRGVHDFLPSRLLRHTLSRKKPVHE